MYLHVGEDVLVRTDEIITILDKGTVKDSVIIQEFLQEKKKNTVNLSKGEFKSLVITDHQYYLSPLASNTLLKRLNLQNE
ncbi:extracellular matrix regulator RemB [Heyndrickxia sp. NPDC080065]|uniref:extracellular matrix regulator RemB n=1 Tax=Heyndrickxia sp. NPDC080065 TaxID=3390568 RepID=UPI003D00F454